MKTNSYPAWFYGPNGASEIFERDEDVPAGWQDHPSKTITADNTGSRPAPPKLDTVPPADRGSAPIVAGNAATGSETGAAAPLKETSDVSNEVDAAGWAWDPNLHASTKAKTNAGLWRMKVGATRPEPKPGFPKPALDL